MPPPHSAYPGYPPQPTPYAPAPSPAYGAPAGGAAAAAQGQPIEIGIEDHHVGAILGRGGSVIAELQQISGARIQLAQKGEYIPGTRTRALTITGTHAACQVYHPVTELL